jgi:hypothetical protein
MSEESKEEFKITRSTIKYDLLTRGDGTRGIRCKKCNKISWHPLDAKYRYCNNCKIFIYLITEVLSGLGG